MNFYIKSWSQDNLGSEIDYFKKLFAQCMKWILYHLQLNTPLQALRRLGLFTKKNPYSVHSNQQEAVRFMEEKNALLKLMDDTHAKSSCSANKLSSTISL